MSAGSVFVTGGTGLVGGRLVEALLARGASVRALARATSDRSGIGAAAGPGRLEWVTGDLLDQDSLRRGMEGCAQAYHVAAFAKNWARDAQTFRRLNADAARTVFEAARDAGVRRVVYTSTVVVFGPTPPGVVGDETTRRTVPPFTEYEESKIAGAEEARRAAAGGLDVVLVHPTRVYGPGRLTEGNSVSTMLDLGDRGRFPFLAGAATVASYVLADDLAEGHLLAMERGRRGESYLLGGENVSLAGLFAMVDELTGRRHLRFDLPRALARTYAHVERRRAEWFRGHPAITPGWVETFLHDWAYSSAKAERELGWRATPLREGVRRTLDWMRARRGAPPCPVRSMHDDAAGAPSAVPPVVRGPAGGGAGR